MPSFLFSFYYIPSLKPAQWTVSPIFYSKKTGLSRSRSFLNSLRRSVLGLFSYAENRRFPGADDTLLVIVKIIIIIQGNSNR